MHFYNFRTNLKFPFRHIVSGRPKVSSLLRNFIIKSPARVLSNAPTENKQQFEWLVAAVTMTDGYSM